MTDPQPYTDAPQAPPGEWVPPPPATPAPSTATTMTTTAVKGDPIADALQRNANPMAMTPDEQAAVDEMYRTLAPEATLAYVTFFLNRTPAKYQDAMKTAVEANLPNPPDPIEPPPPAPPPPQAPDQGASQLPA